ncbi:glutathione ABC transporter ATP-binding protein [Pandoraea iniqua]|uniref:Glutathione ABC transporter ATP-binding protein n=1 Tax=Pandoraea iniqua TaxID=2508288 RepID=A0A5E4VUC1_9BURK|nr:ABC transporter ATP-binding protein [Pandoraea iniqua]VVE15523.1 glutathione ABC transporter ATP-binding protein [Pandoraea iniqua]
MKPDHNTLEPSGNECLGDGLSISNLSIAYQVDGALHPVLRGVSLKVARGQAYGLVGESGCGKSTVALAAVRYLPGNAVVQSGEISIAGVPLMSLDKTSLRTLRARSISMVYQNPGAALNPAMSVGRQLIEAFVVAGTPAGQAEHEAQALLKRVRIASPERVMASYAHQLSGGMQQRVVIAMALASRPSVLILDEPTTGLDVTVEADILSLIDSLRREFNTAILLISHNLAVVRRVCDHVGVLYAGRIVEQGDTASVFRTPRHPYTTALLRCLPGSPHAPRNKYAGRLETIPGNLPQPSDSLLGCLYAPRCRAADAQCHATRPVWQENFPLGHGLACFHPNDATDGDTVHAGLPAYDTGPQPAHDENPLVLEARGLSKTFRIGNTSVSAVRDAFLDLPGGQTLGLVGESGSGKSTLAKMLLGLTAPDTGGDIKLAGEPLSARATRRTHQQLKALQAVFQNPDTAMNRAHTVEQILKRSLSKLGGFKGDRLIAQMTALADAVKLPARHLTFRNRQLSGGQKQRLAIARAFAGDPKVVICDEPTSALDVSVQAAVLNLLADLQRTRGVGYLLISHDLNVIRYLSDRVAVMYLGQILEIGSADEVFGTANHPYTETLLSMTPSMHAPLSTKRVSSSGELPSPAEVSGGCVFHTRCPRKLGEICESVLPPFPRAGESHYIRCHIPMTELRQMQTPALKHAPANNDH